MVPSGPRKAVLFPGQFEQALADQRIDQVIGGALDADERGGPRNTVGWG